MPSFLERVAFEKNFWVAKFVQPIPVLANFSWWKVRSVEKQLRTVWGAKPFGIERKFDPEAVETHTSRTSGEIPN